MYFTARTFYFRVITVVLWLPVTDWLECSSGSGICPAGLPWYVHQGICCVRLDSNQRWSLQDLCCYQLDKNHPWSPDDAT